ncbi:SusD family protein [Mariniphaga anaerophila]|uniref:SusD family protein n=1 Tax=Mariniphaga anaerophila TaxID=1484053 RepID=A0A1M5FDZ0_9BACT|nr:RagB/SusD family nutrient uptake outer membrane protein [Mariniphaga anaerophila]SHF89765.1 SusD family protein [Mariniphaga anaerophila]
MKKSIKYKSILLSFILVLFSIGCTNLDEELYKQINADSFYQSYQDIAAGIARVYEHTSWALCNDGSLWKVGELTTDNMSITQKGRHWYDEGNYVKLHGHSWNYIFGDFYTIWRGMYQGVGYANNFYNDLENVIKPNVEKFNITTEDVETLQAEMMVLSAIFHMHILEVFGPGGVIFTPDMGGDERPESETGTALFDFIEKTIVENIGKLGNHVSGTKDDYYGRVDQATAATALVRLYLNANVTIGQEKFAECKVECEKILDGDYGNYELDNSWQLQWNYNNDLSKAIIWCFPGEKNWLRRTTMPCNNHYQTKYFFRSEQGGSCNGPHLQPSQDTDGSFFEDKYAQGSPYQRYFDGDERRVPMHIEDDGTRQGIFLIGTQSVPGATWAGEPAFSFASEEWKFSGNQDTLYFPDRIGRFSEIVSAWQQAGDSRYAGFVDSHNFKYVLKNATSSELKSISSDVATPGLGITKGEENTGFRLNKYPIYPDVFEAGGWNYNSDFVAMRITDVYYALAECELRAGNKERAAQLLDEVRVKYFTQIGANEAATRKAKFEAGEIEDLREPPHSWYEATTETGNIDEFWMNASYVQNPELLDMDELLAEWGREYIGEGFRRMQLRRFDKYTKGRWWNKSVDSDSKYELCPIPLRALNTNVNLVQNPGYQSH